MIRWLLAWVGSVFVPALGAPAAIRDAKPTATGAGKRMRPRICRFWYQMTLRTMLGGALGLLLALGSAGTGALAQQPGEFAYIPNSGAGTVSVIAAIPVDSYPYGVAVSPDGSRVYGTNDECRIQREYQRQLRRWEGQELSENLWCKQVSSPSQLQGYPKT